MHHNMSSTMKAIPFVIGSEILKLKRETQYKTIAIIIIMQVQVKEDGLKRENNAKNAKSVKSE